MHGYSASPASSKNPLTMIPEQAALLPTLQHHQKPRRHLQFFKPLNLATAIFSVHSAKSITKQQHHYVSIKANTTAGNAPVTSVSPRLPSTVLRR